MSNTHVGTLITQEHSIDAFVNFLIQFCLKKHFKSKKSMACMIGVGYRTVLHVTNEPEQYKGASLVFQGLVLYCVGNGISVDEIAQAYYEKQNGQASHRQYLREPDAACRYWLTLRKSAFADKKEEARIAGMCRFLLWMRPIFCDECKPYWLDEGAEACVVRQVFGGIVDELNGAALGPKVQ